MRNNKTIAILGTVGVPANYGGFETLVENLLRHHDSMPDPNNVTVYCSSKSYPSKSQTYLSARLKFVPLNANGIQSVLYDIWSLFSAAWNRSDVILLLGVSGAVALPLVRLVSCARIVTNVDGIEWQRNKWRGLAKLFLRFSEKIAVRFSDEVIADNEAIAAYVEKAYRRKCSVIAYGGDHAIKAEAAMICDLELPEKFALSVCRIEPENNVELIIEAFSRHKAQALVMVGNWGYSDYGRALRKKFSCHNNLVLLDPIYDVGRLKKLRERASFYMHGHSAGGTNPSLVEAMHFGKPVLAFDCDYNRSTTEGKAIFFRDREELQQRLKAMDQAVPEKVGLDMVEIAVRRYTWRIVAEEYFTLLNK